MTAQERGQLAGIEVIPFGLLVVVVGALVVANVWAVIDAKLAVGSAAAEATRTYVEAEAGSDPMVPARVAAEAAVAGMGRDPASLDLRLVSGSLTRCSVVEIEASYPVPALTLPWVGTYGSAFVVSARHREVVDPYRSGLPGVACGG